jgi:plasmid maintenance system antidote protein VapI
MEAKRKFQAWLVETGRTQGTFAVELGISVATLSMILNGHQKCSLELAIQLSELTGLPVQLFAQFRQARQETAA